MADQLREPLMMLGDLVGDLEDLLEDRGRTGGVDVDVGAGPRLAERVRGLTVQLGEPLGDVLLRRLVDDFVTYAEVPDAG